MVSIYVDPQMETNSIRKRGLPIWEYLTLPAHFRTGTPHMEMGSVFLVTSKSRIEEHLPPNFGQEIEIFPLSCDCDTLKGLRIPINRELNETVPRFHMVIAIWKRGFTHPVENPHFHMFIPVPI